MEFNTITEKIIGSAIRVHSALGPGLLENAYEACLIYDIEKNGLMVESQVPVQVMYDDRPMNVIYRIDLLVEDAIIVELKSVREILPIHEAQLLSYLRLNKSHIGLLINFNVTKLIHGIKRMVNDYHENQSIANERAFSVISAPSAVE